MIAWALDLLIGVTLLLLLVLALRRPVARLFGAEWAYALWLLPLLRVVIPPFELFGPAAAPALPTYTVIVIPAAAEAGDAASAGGIDWLTLGLALWLAGAALFLLRQRFSYRSFLEGIGEGRRSRPAEYGGIPVVESGGADGPLAVGLLQPRIIVPTDFTRRYSPAERKLALDHELVHHRRGDLWWNLIALAMLALNWFNPLAWIAFRAFRADQELACDAAVARRRPLAERLDYASALVKSATAHRQVAACPLNGADQLKERLRMMREHRVSRPRTAGGMAALAGLALSGVVISGAGFAKQEQARASAVELIVATPDHPIMAAEEIRLLSAECGSESWDGRLVVENAGAGDGQRIHCGDGRTVEGEQAGDIVARTVALARVQKAAASAQPAAIAPAPVTDVTETAEAQPASLPEVHPAVRQVRRVAFHAVPAAARQHGQEIRLRWGTAPGLPTGEVPEGAPLPPHQAVAIQHLREALPRLAASGRAGPSVEVLRLEELSEERREQIERSIQALRAQALELPAKEGVRVFQWKPAVDRENS